MQNSGSYGAENEHKRNGDTKEDFMSTSRSLGVRKSSNKKLAQPAASESMAHIGELLGISNPNISQSVMISIIEDPIQCGFLLNFCEIEHSTENLCFIMEVVRYRESFCSDKDTWTLSWQQIDEQEGIGSSFLLSEAALKEVDHIPPESDGGLTFRNEDVHISAAGAGAGSGFQLQRGNRTWPSRIIKQETVEGLVQNIWNTYLGDHAASQICVPSVVMSKTKLRIQDLCIYGPEVFGECLLDPIKTLQRDILPRFLCSHVYNTMKARLNSLVHLPPAALLIVPQPPAENSLLFTRDLDYFSEKRMFSLDEILHDRTLHNEFHAHLKKSVQTENLLCVRMVEIFEEMMRSGDREAEAQAWTIFRFFVTPGSAYEVSLYSRHKKELMLQLACPQLGMFDELKKSALSMLSVNFNSYRFTDDYRNLHKIMREQKRKLLKMEKLPSRISAMLGFGQHPHPHQHEGK